MPLTPPGCYWVPRGALDPLSAIGCPRVLLTPPGCHWVPLTPLGAIGYHCLTPPDAIGCPGVPMTPLGAIV